jgi:hypothetical protein
VVLGSYNQIPNYVDVAKSIGANALNISTPVWNLLEASGDAIAAEQQFIDTTLSEGGQIYLNTEPEGLIPFTHFSMEMEYLRSTGIDPITLPRVYIPH